MNKQKALDLAPKLLDTFGVVTIQKEPNMESYTIKIEKNYFQQSKIQQLETIMENSNYEYIIENGVITIGV
jgi:hypothetical protein